MKLRILRKTHKRYDRSDDREYFEYEDKLQYLVSTSILNTIFQEWHDVPIVEVDKEEK